jgi:hypothetical protein
MIDYLMANGIDVEYWDVVPLLRGDFVEFGSKNTAYLRTFRTYNEIEAALQLSENKNAFYVMIVSYCGQFERLFRLLSKYDCKMLQMIWGALPIKSAPKTRFFRLALQNPIELAQRAYLRAKALVSKKLGLVKPFEMVFAGGGVLMRAGHFAKSVIAVNNIDYDRYKAVSIESAQIADSPYAVFLDNYLPYHSDLALSGVKSLNPDEYYETLNNFFHLLECTYQLKVVVAAHPTANYSSAVFNGREIIYGKTAELVKYSELVVAHHSTSISYAVLNKKPLVFVYTNEIKSLYEKNIYAYIQDFSEYLGSSCYNTNEVSASNQIQIKPVDDLRYESYKYDYLTSIQSECSTTQVVILESLNEKWKNTN